MHCMLLLLHQSRWILHTLSVIGLQLNWFYCQLCCSPHSNRSTTVMPSIFIHIYTSVTSNDSSTADNSAIMRPPQNEQEIARNVCMGKQKAAHCAWSLPLTALFTHKSTYTTNIHYVCRVAFVWYAAQAAKSSLFSAGLPPCTAIAGFGRLQAVEIAVALVFISKYA